MHADDHNSPKGNVRGRDECTAERMRKLAGKNEVKSLIKIYISAVVLMISL